VTLGEYLADFKLLIYHFCFVIQLPLVVLKQKIMSMDRSEFLNWMQRIMERFDLLETLTTSNRTSNSQQTQEVLLDNQDLLLMLKVSARSLQRYRSKGILPYYCISGKI